MSLGIVVKGPAGLVLAAESRVTIQAHRGNQRLQVNFDNTTKVFSFSALARGEEDECDVDHGFGAVTYGQAAIGLRTADSFIPEFEAQLPEERLSVHDFAEQLSQFYLEQWDSVMPAEYDGPAMTFVVGGFDRKQSSNQLEPYGKVFLIEIPFNPDPVEKHDSGNFGITWGGQREFVDRLIQGYDENLLRIVAGKCDLDTPEVEELKHELRQVNMSIPLAAMPLQDCVDLAIFFLRTTIAAQRLTVGIRGCGGPVDVATITRRGGLKFVQRKC